MQPAPRRHPPPALSISCSHGTSSFVFHLACSHLALKDQCVTLPSLSSTAHFRKRCVMLLKFQSRFVQSSIQLHFAQTLSLSIVSPEPCYFYINNFDN